MMRTCFNMDPLTVDPRKNGDLISSTFLFMLYDGLTRLLPNGQVELALAESVEISKDQCIYTFKLRHAQWSDGHPITASDFEYSWKKTLDPDFSSSCPQLFYPIKNAEVASEGKISPEEIRIQALDDRTLRIELNSPTPYFLSLISFCNFFPIPRHIEQKNSAWDVQGHAQNHSKIVHQLICSGPFKLVKWDWKKEIVLEKNPLYWDVEQTRLDALHISIINNEYTTLEMFENEELDWISFMLTAIPSSVLGKYIDDGRLKVIPMGGTLFSAFNLHRFPFNNENIRKAFSYAIDRQEIVRQTSQLNEIPAKRLIPPVMESSELSSPLLFDEKLARHYLQKGLLEFGILKNESESFNMSDLNIRLFLSNLTLSYDNTQAQRNVAHALQEQWGRVLGFRIKLVQQDYKTQMEKITQGDFNIALKICLAHYNDPLNILERFKYKYLSRNFPKFESPEYIDLLDRSSKTYNPKARQKILAQAEEHLLDKMPLAPIYHLNYPILSNSSVHGVELSPIGGLQFRKATFRSSKLRKKQIAVSQ